MNVRIQRFAGISLGGGKNDRTSVAVIEYYPMQKRIFLRHLRDKIKPEEEVSTDLVLHRFLTEKEIGIEAIGFDVPTQLPKCMRCKLRCPGYEKCKEPEIKWLWEKHREQSAKKKTLRIFTPYTERCVDSVLQYDMESPFLPGHALGANLAPLTARAHFLIRRLKIPTYETYLPASIWRIGRELGLSKGMLQKEILTVGGESARAEFLDAVASRKLIFLYHQDQKILTESLSAFNSFITAIVIHLAVNGQCEKRPVGFPRKEAWTMIPKKEFRWNG